MEVWVIGSSSASLDRGSRAVRAGAALHVFLGVAFGASIPFVLAHLARHGELPMSPFGWRYMAGPFEQLGTEWFTALGWALVGVSTLDVLAGIWLWQGRRRGLRLGLVTTVPAFMLGAGFELPLLLVGVPIRAALDVAGHRQSPMSDQSVTQGASTDATLRK
jgi:hypothetical protein